MASNASLPLTLDFTAPGGISFTRTVVPNASGAFTLSRILPQNYQVRVKSLYSLSRTVPLNATPSSTVSFSSTLVAGDIDGNNLVDLTDVIALLNAYGASVGQSQYVVGADLNQSGGVDLTDLLGLLNNYGMTGN